MTNKNAPEPSSSLPTWLTGTQVYEPRPDRTSFISKSVLSITAILRQLRLDDGKAARFSPIAPLKLLLLFGALLINSLSQNLMVSLMLLAFVLLRALFLPSKALARLVAVTLSAATFVFILSLPAVFLGQSSSAVRLGIKALVSTGLAMEFALGTPVFQLTSALRSFRIPNIVIMTIELALKNIVKLGECALETLTALRLRSVGKDDHKQASLGGVSATLLVRASVSAQDTYDAMICRGFDGTYKPSPRIKLKPIDLLWMLAFALFVGLTLHLEGILLT